jgi:hypothetical protein
MGQSETLSQQSGHIYYTLLCEFVHTPLLLLLLFSPATAICGIMLNQNHHFPHPTPHILTFLYAILVCRITNSAPR